MYDIDKDVIRPLLKKDISFCKINSFWLRKLYLINKTFEASHERWIQTVYRECALTKPTNLYPLYITIQLFLYCYLLQRNYNIFRESIHKYLKTCWSIIDYSRAPVFIDSVSAIYRGLPKHWKIKEINGLWVSKRTPSENGP